MRCRGLYRGEGRRWGYFLNPKVACMSMLQALPHTEADSINDLGGRAAGNVGRGLLYSDLHGWRELPDWCFSFVRHPLDRVVSWWLNKICRSSASAERYRRRYKWEQGTPLERAVKRIIEDHSEWHIAPQTEVLPVGCLNFVGRFEAIEADWRRVMENVPGAKLLPRVNCSEGRQDWREYFADVPAADLNRLVDVYTDDFLTFRYSL